MGRALRVRGCEPRGVTELRKELSGVADVVDGDDAVNDGIERRRQETVHVESVFVADRLAGVAEIMVERKDDAAGALDEEARLAQPQQGDMTR